MLFLPPNQQRQNTEGIHVKQNGNKTLKHIPRHFGNVSESFRAHYHIYFHAEKYANSEIVSITNDYDVTTAMSVCQATSLQTNQQISINFICISIQQRALISCNKHCLLIIPLILQYVCYDTCCKL